MTSWLEVSSGVIAKAEPAEIRLKITATERNMRSLLLDDFEFVTRELQRPRAKCQNYFSTRDCRMKKGKRNESRPETSAGTARKEAVRAQWRTPRNSLSRSRKPIPQEEVLTSAAGICSHATFAICV